MHLISTHEFTFTGDLTPIFPNFSYYNPRTYEWLFKWDEWLRDLENAPVDIVPETPPSNNPVHYDSIDLHIIAYLELNARFSFSEMASKIGLSPQTVKDRYDTKLVPNGIVKHFEINVQPYPTEMLASHNIILHFTNETQMGRFHSLAKHQLFFVQEFAKVQGENTLSLITRTPHQQVPQMLGFFSRLCEDGRLNDYSATRRDLFHRETSTINPNIFDDAKGKWIFDIYSNLLRLNQL
jgi:DNA-binding Lrp family transcriptional regulator